MDIEDGQIGRRVREIRLWRGMNLAAVAGLAGLSTSFLSMVERGQRPITKRVHLERLADALRVSPADL
ncbi:MAG: helix-turn-helix transcriptional regulator, partial [Kibdelosporangium sp.]